MPSEGGAGAGDQISRGSGPRLAVARQLGAVYAAQGAVQAVLCTGSTGRGDADRWSDLELGVVWESAPTAAQRRQAIAATGGQGAQLWPWDDGERLWADAWWHGAPPGHGLLVEVSHTTGAELEDRLAALQRGDPDPLLLSLGDALTSGVALAGLERVAAWRSRITPYPRPLAAAVVRHHGQIDHFWRWQMYVERGNLLQLQLHFGDVATRVVHVACALSGVWWPGPKRLLQTAARLPLGPQDLAARLRRVPHQTPQAAAATLTALVEESYDLVTQHLPEVDAERLRAIFRFARRPWPPATWADGA
ncbi:MAG TPA: hypothetical protein VHN78_16925 [Chloroflexota bacterium]|nr:hypothetical protein [Chloroflexota bacterium]